MVIVTPLSAFVVLSNWRRVQYLKKDTLVLDVTIINECNKFIFFGDTILRGKKNNYVFHNMCLTRLTDFLDKERDNSGKPKMKITWYIWIDIPHNMYAVKKFTRLLLPTKPENIGSFTNWQISYVSNVAMMQLGSLFNPPFKNEIKYDRYTNA